MNFNLNLSDQSSFLHVLIFHGIPYVIATPLFWASMGFTVAISMIITVTLFDHNFTMITRAAFAKLVFIFMLFLVTFSRIDYEIMNFKLNLSNFAQNAQLFAGLATLILLSFFWFLGMFLGVVLMKFQKKQKDNIDTSIFPTIQKNSNNKIASKLDKMKIS
jgi:hypothetical protein